jgi:hypothetical protein
VKIYMVASAVPSWMRTGYGHSLLAGEASDLLISFEEFKRPGVSLPVTSEVMGSSYNPSKADPVEAPS